MVSDPIDSMEKMMVIIVYLYVIIQIIALNLEKVERNTGWRLIKLEFPEQNRSLRTYNL